MIALLNKNARPAALDLQTQATLSKGNFSKNASSGCFKRLSSIYLNVGVLQTVLPSTFFFISSPDRYEGI